MKTLWKSLTLLLIAVFWTPSHVLSQSPNRVCAEATAQGEPTAISFEGTDENGEYVRVVDFMPRLEDHLNSGGTPSTLMAALDDAAAQHEDPWIYDVVLADVTGDGNVEILVQLTWAGGALDGGIFAYRCDQGDYVGYVITPLLTWGVPGGDVQDGLRYVTDMNGNEIPEVVVSHVPNIGTHASYYRSFSIYEWNGDGFSLLIPQNEYGDSLATAFRGDGEPRDVDGDTLQELVLLDSRFQHHDSTEWSRLDRDDEIIWSWNGRMYEKTCTRAATAPEYRIQAVQDGGNAMLCGDYEAALAFYQQVIEDDALLTWTEADNLCPGCAEDDAMLQMNVELVEEMGTPVPDPDERDRLSSYARYRLVLVYAALGQDEEAQAILNELRDSTPKGGVGSEYAVLAQTFWETYRETGDLVDACQAAEEDAETRQITSPLTRYNFYGAFYYPHNYGSEDICPL